MIKRTSWNEAEEAILLNTPSNIIAGLKLNRSANACSGRRYDLKAKGIIGVAVKRFSLRKAKQIIQREQSEQTQLFDVGKLFPTQTKLPENVVAFIELNNASMLNAKNVPEKETKEILISMANNLTVILISDYEITVPGNLQMQRIGNKITFL